MAQVSIPVDLLNPGQVFACMGFLEAADVLLGEAEGGFDWTNESDVFKLHAAGTASPVDAVLEFLVDAEVVRLAPEGYNEANEPKGDGPVRLLATFPAPEADRMALPLRFERNGRILNVSHWCDASSRNAFKLFAGQQRSAAIAQHMLVSVKNLWDERRAELTSNPLGLTAPLGGSSFKFDARKAWTTLDAGYSPDDQNHAVEASPVVEILAAIGLEHARPDEFETDEVRYGVWRGLLPPALARPALGGARVGLPLRICRFTLARSGKNKNVTFAQEEASL